MQKVPRGGATFFTHTVYTLLQLHTTANFNELVFSWRWVNFIPSHRKLQEPAWYVRLNQLSVGWQVLLKSMQFHFNVMRLTVAGRVEARTPVCHSVSDTEQQTAADHTASLWDCSDSSLLTPGYTHTHTRTHTHRCFPFLSVCMEVEHCTSQLVEPRNFSQPRNATLIHEFYLTTTEILEYTPTQRLPTRACKVMMERGFTWVTADVITVQCWQKHATFTHLHTVATHVRRCRCDITVQCCQKHATFTHCRNTLASSKTQTEAVLHSNQTVYSCIDATNTRWHNNTPDPCIMCTMFSDAHVWKVCTILGAIWR